MHLEGKKEPRPESKGDSVKGVLFDREKTLVRKALYFLYHVINSAVCLGEGWLFDTAARYLQLVGCPARLLFVHEWCFFPKTKNSTFFIFLTPWQNTATTMKARTRSKT